MRREHRGARGRSARGSRPGLGLLWALALALGASCQELSTRAAHRAAREGRLEEAARAYAALLAGAPGDLELRCARAAALLRLGRLDEAEATLAPALAAPGPVAAPLREAWAELALARGQPERALEALGDAGAPPGGELLARALLARGQAGDAARALEALGPAGADAGVPRAYLAGLALLALGRPADAQAALEGLVATAPAWAHYGLARVAAARADAPAAERALARARAAAGARWRPEAAAADPAFDFLRDRPPLTTAAP